MSINLHEQHEWRYLCPETNLLYPWYVKPFLDLLSTWDLKDKIIFESGCGSSTLWWVEKCKFVYGVETSGDYITAIESGLQGKHNYNIFHETEVEKFANAPIYVGKKFDIFIIDGVWRDECVPQAIQTLKDGGILIIDNWLQPSVGVASEEIQQLLSKYEGEVFKEPTHPDWQTAYWRITK